MKFYRNSYTDEDGEHAGYEYFSSKAEADKVWVQRHKYGSVINGDHSTRAVLFESGNRKSDITCLLNQYASYPASEFCADAFEPGDGGPKKC